MAKTLTLEISDSIYELLLKASRQIGQPPEQIISEWIESKAKQASQDPLLQLAGTFESDITNIGEQHDKFIGEALRDNSA